MFVRYKLFRAKNDEMFNAEMIQFNIENDDHLVKLDEILTSILTQHISNLDIVKQYGIGYVGKMEIVNIEITDDDVIDLDETQFKCFISTVLPGITVVWSRTTIDTNAE